MELVTYYKVVVKVEIEDEKGKVKKTPELYIVEAVSPTDVETKIAKKLTGLDYEIAGINITKIIEIIR